MKAMRKTKRKPHKLRIKAKEYRGQLGWSIYGRLERGGWGVRIFCLTRDGAAICRLASEAGDHDLIDRILRKGG